MSDWEIVKNDAGVYAYYSDGKHLVSLFRDEQSPWGWGAVLGKDLPPDNDTDIITAYQARAIAVLLGLEAECRKH